MKLTGWMLLAILPASAAFAQQPAADEAARKALAAGEHAKVIAAYEPELKAGATLSDMAQYRLAIAYNRMGDAPRASAALRAALAANPQGSFATNPARLQQLQASIAEACAKAEPPGCAAQADSAQSSAAAPAAPSGAAKAATEPAAATDGDSAATPRAGEPLPGAGQGPTGQIAPEMSASQGAASGEAALKTSLNAAAAKAADAWAFEFEGQDVAAYLVIPLAVLALAGLIAFAVTRRRRAPQWQPLVDLRDRTEAVIRSLEQSPVGPQTAVYQALQQLLPLLEREVGRSQWRAGAPAARLVPADRELVEAAARLSREPLDALKATPEAVRALFQRPVL